MTSSLLTPTLPSDQAGAWAANPKLNQVCQRIRTLVHTHLTPDHLHGRLQDLPAQFVRPQPRPWPTLAWATLHPDQVSGIPLDTFCQILKGTFNTEAPIRGYTQASRQYLEPFYPEMARLVGGLVQADGQLAALGLWEIEEKRHTPALLQIYTRLTGHKPTPVPHAARPYTPSTDPRADLYRHGLHRIATEYGATCLYLWMMAYTTGPLQQVLEQLLIDEINHMTKFWGFGLWAYPEASLVKNCQVLGQAMVRKLCDRTLQGSLVHTLRRMMDELAWQQWSWTHRLTFLYTFDQAMRVLWHWQGELTHEYLEGLFGQNPFDGPAP